jgi:hypothetical protein
MTNESVAIQQVIIEASIQNRHSTELDAEFDKLDKAKNFEWWLSQVKGHLQHDAWSNVLGEGEPYVTPMGSKDISNKLYQRIHQSMTAATGDVLARNESEFGGKGLELVQALINHFIPSDSVALPDIFKEWHRHSKSLTPEL